MPTQTHNRITTLVENNLTGMKSGLRPRIYNSDGYTALDDSSDDDKKAANVSALRRSYMRLRRIPFKTLILAIFLFCGGCILLPAGSMLLWDGSDNERAFAMLIIGPTSIPCFITHPFLPLPHQAPSCSSLACTVQPSSHFT